MQIPVSCVCGRKYLADSAQQGQVLRCPNCGNGIQVPSPPSTAEGAIVSCACGQSFKAPPHLIGQTVPCPSCQQPLTIVDQVAAQRAAQLQQQAENHLLDNVASAAQFPMGVGTPVSSFGTTPSDWGSYDNQPMSASSKTMIDIGVRLLAVVLCIAGIGLAIHGFSNMPSTVQGRVSNSTDGYMAKIFFGFLLAIPSLVMAIKGVNFNSNAGEIRIQGLIHTLSSGGVSVVGVFVVYLCATTNSPIVLLPYGMIIGGALYAGIGVVSAITGHRLIEDGD